jgi:hypothetical protein
MKIDYDSSRLLLDWVLRRGREVLRLQVERTGDRYQVSVSPANRQHKKPLYTNVFHACPNAFQRHAALVASFREAGWASVAYR